MKIIWTDPAVNDLDNIQSYIAQDSERYASIVIERIILATGNIEFFPFMGRMVPEVAETTIREILVHPYRVIYRTKENLIEILTVIHQARDLTNILERI